MQVRMAVPVRGRKSEDPEPFELRPDFVTQRRPKSVVKNVPQPSPRWRGHESAPRIRERGNARRPACAERQMQTDAERRMAAGDAHGFVHRGLIDHEAGLSQEAGFEATLNGFVDFVTATEVVGGEDELFQSADGAFILRAAPMTTRPMIASPRRA